LIHILLEGVHKYCSAAFAWWLWRRVRNSCGS
jgi:hypothetical protein